MLLRFQSSFSCSPGKHNQAPGPLTPPSVQQHKALGCRTLPGSFTSTLRVEPETCQSQEVAAKSVAGTTSECPQHGCHCQGQVKEWCRHCCARPQTVLGHGEVQHGWAAAPSCWRLCGKRAGMEKVPPRTHISPPVGVRVLLGSLLPVLKLPPHPKWESNTFGRSQRLWPGGHNAHRDWCRYTG